MGTLLFLLFIFIVVIPLLKTLFRFWPVIRQYRNMRSQVNETFRAAQEQQRQQQQEYSQRTSGGKKKKIDPSVGEFVNFEEIKSSDSEAQEPKQRPNLRQETQVEDAVWEDIK